MQKINLDHLYDLKKKKLPCQLIASASQEHKREGALTEVPTVCALQLAVIISFNSRTTLKSRYHYAHVTGLMGGMAATVLLEACS